MSACVFATFSDASAFAKRMALEHKAIVHVVRRGNEFVVEGTFPADYSVQVEHEPEGLACGETSRLSATATPPRAAKVESTADVKWCVECGVAIPHARLVAIPTVSRCTKCQSEFERSHDTRPRVNEGIAGTRDENKKMRGQLWGDMRNRGKDR